MRRTLIRLVVGVVAALAVAAPAAAVGVNDVDLQVVLPRDAAGRAVLELGTEPVTLGLRLRNVADEPRSVRLYAVAASTAADGGFAFGSAGTADWLDLDDEEISLAGREERVLEVVADPDRLGREPASHAGVVIEAGSGSTMVTRAVSVFRVNATGALGSPRAPLFVALALLLLVIAAHVLRRRLERRRATRVVPQRVAARLLAA